MNKFKRHFLNLFGKSDINDHSELLDNYPFSIDNVIVNGNNVRFPLDEKHFYGRVYATKRKSGLYDIKMSIQVYENSHITVDDVKNKILSAISICKNP